MGTEILVSKVTVPFLNPQASSNLREMPIHGLLQVSVIEVILIGVQVLPTPIRRLLHMRTLRQKHLLSSWIKHCGKDV